MHKVAIHGVPRSGSTWIGSIFDSSPNVVYRLQPLFSYAFKSYLHQSSSKDDIDKFFDIIAKSDDEFITQKEGKTVGSIPTFAKQDPSHIVYKEVRYNHIIKNLLEKDSSIKIVGVVRNPKSVISSWSKAPKEFNSQEWNLMEQWRTAYLKNGDRVEEFYGYDKWKEVALLFLELAKTYPNQFYLIRYKDLLDNTEEEVNRMFQFCGLEYTAQTAKFLKDSNDSDLSKDAYSVYRKNQSDNKWVHDLPQSIINEIDEDINGTTLQQFIK